MDLLRGLLLRKAEEEDQRGRAEGKGERIIIQFEMSLFNSDYVTVTVCLLLRMKMKSPEILTKFFVCFVRRRGRRGCWECCSAPTTPRC